MSGSNGDRSGTIAGASVQRALPVGEGLGYRFTWQDGSFSSVSGAFQAQSRYGRVDAISYDFGDARQTSLGVSARAGLRRPRRPPDAHHRRCLCIDQSAGPVECEDVLDGQYVGADESGEALPARTSFLITRTSSGSPARMCRSIRSSNRSIRSCRRACAAERRSASRPHVPAASSGAFDACFPQGRRRRCRVTSFSKMVRVLRWGATASCFRESAAGSPPR